MPPERGARFDVTEVPGGPGRLDLILEGPDERVRPFLLESGGHRWQRVPPTERAGRIHSSTITVVAMEIRPDDPFRLEPRDVTIETMRGSGAGGQHRNVTESAVRLRHVPTGIEVRICTERSQHRNRELAQQLLAARVQAFHRAGARSATDARRRDLAGSGERGDKIRTVRVRDGMVVDHRSGRRSSLEQFMRGVLPA